MFRLAMSTDNAAFKENHGAECTRILKEVITALQHGATSGNLFDGDYNRVGDWSLTKE